MLCGREGSRLVPQGTTNVTAGTLAPWVATDLGSDDQIALINATSTHSENAISLSKETTKV